MLPTFDGINKYNDKIEKDINMLNDIFDRIDQEVVFSSPSPASGKPYTPPVVDSYQNPANPEYVY